MQKGVVGLPILLGALFVLFLVAGGAYIVGRQASASQPRVVNELPVPDTSTTIHPATANIQLKGTHGAPANATVGDVSFSVPADWRSAGTGIYVSPDYAIAPTPPSHVQLGYNYNSVLHGAKIVITDDNVTPVVASIDSAEAYADFQLPILKGCSNCSSVRKIYLDGVAAVFSQDTADDHGGWATVSGRVNHRGFTASIYYATSYEDVKAVFEQFLDSIQISKSPSEISVAGMQKYTDADFGFSFWYPSDWTVSSIPASPHQVYFYPGGMVVKQITAKSNTNSNVTVVIEEFTSPAMTVTDSSGVGACPVCVAVRYYFDADSHTWMFQFPDGTETGKPAGFTEAIDTSPNTMGGLHMFGGSQRFGANKIIPLSAHNFLLVSVGGYLATMMGESAHTFTKTIVAIDASVATPVSIGEQMKVIQAEKDAYAGQ